MLANPTDHADADHADTCHADTYHADNGAAHELFLGRWTKRLAQPLLDFAGFAAEGALLDVGTGTGSLAFAMAARWPGRKVLVIDPAAPYIAYARSQASGSQPVFETCDAAALRHQDASFAGVAAQLVLNFVPQARVAVAEMRRVTKPNLRHQSFGRSPAPH